MHQLIFALSNDLLYDIYPSISLLKLCVLIDVVTI